MIFNKLIIALTTRRFVENKLQSVVVKPDGPRFSSRNKYLQKKDK